MTFIKETSPHIHRKDSLTRMLGDVIIALLPVVVMSFVAFGLLAMRNLLIPVAVMTLAEFIFVLIANRVPFDGEKHPFKEHWQRAIKAYRPYHFLGPVVSGLIFGLVMPPSSNPGYVIYFALVLGSIFGIVVGKLVFGGLGQNIFNPAAAGMVFAKLCFGSKYVYSTTYYVNSVTSGGTVLTNLTANSENLLGRYANIGDISLLDMFLGRIPGVIGEGFKFAILIGLIYLLIRHAADIRVVGSYLLGFTFLMAIAGIFVATKVAGVDYFHFLAFELLSGGLLFGATFMFTDPVTMPINSPGRIMYGLLGAVLTVIIRLFAALPEGVAFSILICNLCAPAMDHFTISGNRLTWKKVACMAGILAVGVLAVCLGLGFVEVAA